MADQLLKLSIHILSIGTQLLEALKSGAEREARLEGELVRMREELAHANRLAMKDSLTGLPNGKGLSRAYETLLCDIERERTGDSVIAYIDLIGFKLVNDTLGHMRGDAALVEVTEALVGLSRPGDTIARLHGDEFAILLLGVSMSEAREVVERMRAAVRDLRPDGYETDEALKNVVVDFSYGLCRIHSGYPCDAASALAVAERAMYASRGKNLR